MNDLHGFQRLPNFALDAIYHAASTHARMLGLLRHGGQVPATLEEDIQDTYGKLQDIIIGQEYKRVRIAYVENRGISPGGA